MEKRKFYFTNPSYPSEDPRDAVERVDETAAGGEIHGAEEEEEAADGDDSL